MHVPTASIPCFSHLHQAPGYNAFEASAYPATLAASILVKRVLLEMPPDYDFTNTPGAISVFRTPIGGNLWERFPPNERSSVSESKKLVGTGHYTTVDGIDRSVRKPTPPPSPLFVRVGQGHAMLFVC